MHKFYVYLAVIICGASVLAVEVLGTRVIAPFYGASLYLWSALISVTLAALSLGYVIGGRWADRGATIPRLSLIVGLAGLWIALIPWLRTPVLAMAEPFGLRTAVLMTATVLFFPPLALLGMISPYVIRLRAGSLDVVGRTAGDLYALSTLASVAAALVTGFILIPNVGVSRLLLIIGGLLLATSALGFYGQKRLLFATALTLLLGVLSLLFFAPPGTVIDDSSGLLMVRESPYSEIRVVEMDGTRNLLIDGSLHTGIDLTTWQTSFSYVNVLDLPKLFFDEPGSALLIGLGGGSVVKNYTRDNWRIEAVEIDPAVTETARQYFGLMEAEAQVYHMDGRQFLIDRDTAYDVILMDAFGSSSVPFHLVTEEAFALVRSRLRPNGILAVNLQCVGWDDKIVASVAATIGRAFSHVRALPIAEPPDQLGNLVIIASDRPLELRGDLPQPEYRISPQYDRVHAWDNRFQPDTADILVLTDELNPIDVWSERVNLVSRRELHAYLADRRIAW
ncbi:MAG: fused MFS/spermidine synthase [candidate division Zixibacteria bacterium]|nr:fused MFS/spermidine synthase [candidate division Zixibacteria bacterium]